MGARNDRRIARNVLRGCGGSWYHENSRAEGAPRGGAFGARARPRIAAHTLMRRRPPQGGQAERRAHSRREVTKFEQKGETVLKTSRANGHSTNGQRLTSQRAGLSRARCRETAERPHPTGRLFCGGTEAIIQNAVFCLAALGAPRRDLLRAAIQNADTFCIAPPAPQRRAPEPTAAAHLIGAGQG